jgi:hypothetical protein
LLWDVKIPLKNVKLLTSEVAVSHENAQYLESKEEAPTHSSTEESVQIACEKSWNQGELKKSIFAIF